MNYIYLIIFGVLGGVLAGMGMGGGTLLIPLLTLILGFTQKSAQAINLIAFVPMSIIAIIIHSKNGFIKFKTGIFIAIFGILSSIGGAMLAKNFDSKQLSIYFGIFLLVLGILQIIFMIIRQNNLKKD